MKADFKLKCCVKIHDSEVRVLSPVVANEGSFVSGTTDSTFCLWSPKT